MEKAIIANNITKKYKLYQNTKERLLDLMTPKDYGDDFYALANVSFEANKGDIIGFIGVNGSGKSTLSNIIAGIVPETSGEVMVNGEASLIAVSAGLKGDLTGRDNIELKCLMLGFSKQEIAELEPKIIEFSELGQFIDQPVKSYSSGMRSRLGFAISVNVDPDILIIDEALSVGDRAFAEKSFEKMLEFKAQGKTMIFVSHALGQLKKFCEKVLWLEYGMVRDFGPVQEVLPKYEAFLKQWRKMSKKSRDAYRQEILKYQAQMLKNPKQMKTFPGWEIKEEAPAKKKSVYKEEWISRLGKIKSEEHFIFSSPKEQTHKKLAKGFTDSVYFIKKKATYKDQTFYLLSHKPSANKGTVGWIQAKHTTSHAHVFIDQDEKEFILKGKGIAYNRPWGGRENTIFPQLKPYKGTSFYVNQTEKVGNNLWYRGTLNDEEVWIHSSHLEQKINSSS